MFIHGALRSSQELVQKCPCIPGSNWNLEMLVFKEGKTGVPGEKPLGAEKRTNNKLNLLLGCTPYEKERIVIIRTFVIVVDNRSIIFVHNLMS